MNLPARVKAIIQNQHLLQPGATVIVGVSGGADSVTLLHILHELRYELGIQIHVAHFNHRLRRGARGDQEFVEDFTSRLKLPLSCARRTGPAFGLKGSLEDHARQWRFNFFLKLAKKMKTDVVVLAHTQDDLAETVLMRVVRGTGLLGLGGIAPEAHFKGIRIIRPLLSVARTEIERYLQEHRLSYRVDPTNRLEKFFRNKIRWRLLPLLEREYQKNIKSHLAHLANSAAVDYECLEGQAREILNARLRPIKNSKYIRVPLKDLHRCHLSLRRIILRLAFARLKGDLRRLTWRHIEELEDLLAHRPAGSVVDLPVAVAVTKEKKYLLFHTRRSRTPSLRSSR